jgi:hypothetical protein
MIDELLELSRRIGGGEVARNTAIAPTCKDSPRTKNKNGNLERGELVTPPESKPTM